MGRSSGGLQQCSSPAPVRVSNPSEHPTLWIWRLSDTVAVSEVSTSGTFRGLLTTEAGPCVQGVIGEEEPRARSPSLFWDRQLGPPRIGGKPWKTEHFNSIPSVLRANMSLFESLTSEPPPELEDSTETLKKSGRPMSPCWVFAVSKIFQDNSLVAPCRPVLSPNSLNPRGSSSEFPHHTTPRCERVNRIARGGRTSLPLMLPATRAHGQSKVQDRKLAARRIALLAMTVPSA